MEYFSHGGMSHGGMNHVGMNHGINHGGMNHVGMSHGGINHVGINHVGMNHAGISHGRINKYHPHYQRYPISGYSYGYESPYLTSCPCDCLYYESYLSCQRRRYINGCY
jgi:hypothetical protein